MEEVAAKIVRKFFTISLPQLKQCGLLLLFEAAVLQRRIEIVGLADGLSDEFFAEELLRGTVLLLERFLSEQSSCNNLIVR